MNDASVVRAWGSTPDERAASYPCDRFLDDSAATAFRAVDVDAPPKVTFRWLCQLRVAPYSYDALDNFGRPSPPRLIDGLEELEIGQRFMTIFKLVDFEPNRQITLVTAGTIFGRVAGTYTVKPRPNRQSRIVVKLRWDVPSPLPSPLKRLVPLESAALLGDLVMMRRQLLNLKRLAEAQAS